MSSKAQLDRSLELLFDAISSLNFEEIPPAPKRGESSRLTTEAKGKAKQESSPIIWEDIPVLSLACLVEPLLILRLLALVLP
jgi:hypothetical protein